MYQQKPLGLVPLLTFSLGFFFNNCGIGTNMSTRPAFYTGINNFIKPFILDDRSCRADFPTRTTNNTIFGDEVGHSFLPFISNHITSPVEMFSKFSTIKGRRS